MNYIIVCVFNKVGIMLLTHKIVASLTPFFRSSESNNFVMSDSTLVFLSPTRLA